MKLLQLLCFLSLATGASAAACTNLKTFLAGNTATLEKISVLVKEYHDLMAAAEGAGSTATLTAFYACKDAQGNRKTAPQDCLEDIGGCDVTLEELASVDLSGTTLTNEYKNYFGGDADFLHKRFQAINGFTGDWADLSPVVAPNTALAKIAAQAEGFKKTSMDALPVYLMMYLLDVKTAQSMKNAKDLYLGDGGTAVAPHSYSPAAVAKKRCKNYKFVIRDASDARLPTGATGAAAACGDNDIAPQTTMIITALDLADTALAGGSTDVSAHVDTVIEYLKLTYAWASLRYLNYLTLNVNMCPPVASREQQGEGLAFFYVMAPKFVEATATYIKSVYILDKPLGATPLDVTNKDTPYCKALKSFTDTTRDFAAAAKTAELGALSAFEGDCTVTGPTPPTCTKAHLTTHADASHISTCTDVSHISTLVGRFHGKMGAAESAGSTATLKTFYECTGRTGECVQRLGDNPSKSCTVTLKELTNIDFTHGNSAKYTDKYVAHFGSYKFLSNRMDDIFNIAGDWANLDEPDGPNTAAHKLGAQIEGLKKTSMDALQVYLMQYYLDLEDFVRAKKVYFGSGGTAAAPHSNSPGAVAKKRCKNYESTANTADSTQAVCGADDTAPQNTAIDAELSKTTGKAAAVLAVVEQLKLTYAWASLRYLGKVDDDFNKCPAAVPTREHQGEGLAFFFVMAPHFSAATRTYIKGVYTATTPTVRGTTNKDSKYCKGRGEMIKVGGKFNGKDAKLGKLISPAVGDCSANSAGSITCPAPATKAATTESPAAAASLNWLVLLGSVVALAVARH